MEAAGIATSSPSDGSRTLARIVDQASTGTHDAIDKVSDAARPAVDRIALGAHKAVDKIAGTAAQAAEAVGVKGSNSRMLRCERWSSAAGTCVTTLRRPWA